MMQTQVLTNSNRQPVAEIISDRKGKQEIKFLDFSLLERIKQARGIAVTPLFHKEYQSKWRILPSDPLFALAFMKCHINDLRKQGYSLRPKDEFDGLSDEEIAKRIL
jgi:hypothetical protein